MLRLLLVLFCTSFFLVGCESGTEPETMPDQGDVLGKLHLGTYTPELFATLSANFGYSLELDYSVEAYQVEYQTLSPDGERTVASGALLVPQEVDTFSVLSWQHGTLLERNGVGSRNPLFYAIDAIMYAGNGYLVSVPDYLGLGSSEILQPYLLYEPTATAVVDMLRAVLIISEESNYFLNNKFYLAGYSGGGYATLATQKYMENVLPGEFNLLGVAPMAGPYDLLQTSHMILSQESFSEPALMAFAITAYDTYLGWGRLADIFRSPFNADVTTYFNGGQTLQSVNELLPEARSQLYQDTFIQNLLDGTDPLVEAALVENSLTDWTPQTPIRFFHGTADEIVPYPIATAARDSLRSKGATSVELMPVINGTHIEAYFPSLLLSLAWIDSIDAVN